MGLSGNILVKSNNVFDIREDYSLNIQNVRKIYLLFFFQYLSEKSLEVSRNFSRGGDDRPKNIIRNCSIFLVWENGILSIRLQFTPL